ncbi:MAG: DUF2301 domain-containing membrane protein, partial [Cyanobacteria bacterium J06642_3]
MIICPNSSKEAFCFNRLETKILTPIVPLLLLGHM